MATRQLEYEENYVVLESSLSAQDEKHVVHCGRTQTL